MRSARLGFASLLGVLLLVASCKGGDDASPAAKEKVAASRRPNLQWKRYAALENDLAQALELDPGEICQEFGRNSCIEEVHLAPLGGNEPFKTGLLEPSAEPLATTPAVVERVLLSACSKRVELDRQTPEAAKVFTSLDLAARAPAPGSDAARATVTELYHRLLARDPLPSEVLAVAQLAQDGAGQSISAVEFASLSCFAIGTTSEFLFF